VCGVERRAAAARLADHRVAPPLEHLAGELSEDGLVIDDQDASGHAVMLVSTRCGFDTAVA
jgi:hypothetical protein